jgi:hypothetical protein
MKKEHLEDTVEENTPEKNSLRNKIKKTAKEFAYGSVFIATINGIAYSIDYIYNLKSGIDYYSPIGRNLLTSAAIYATFRICYECIKDGGVDNKYNEEIDNIKKSI